MIDYCEAVGPKGSCAGWECASCTECMRNPARPVRVKKMSFFDKIKSIFRRR